MKKQYLFFLFCIQILSAKEIKITGFFAHKDMAAAYVAIQGAIDKDNKTPEARVTQGEFSFTLPENTKPGVYKLAFGMQEKVYFYWIHTGEKKYHWIFKNKDNKWIMECESTPSYRYLTQYKSEEEKLLKTLGILYDFVGNYPEKESVVYKEALNQLNEKTKAFEVFRTKGISNAPVHVKDVLEQNQIYLYNPLWNEKQLEENFEATFWNSWPKNDDSFYLKPFFQDKLEMFLSNIFENRSLKEEEKFNKAKKRILLTINKFANNPQKNYYYNLMIRYLVMTQQPFYIYLIDPFLDPKSFLSATDAEGYNYRLEQKQLVTQKAPEIKNLEIEKIDKEIIVFVGGNSEYSLAILQKLKQEVQKNETLKITVILFTDNSDSIQNFKILFPFWDVHTYSGTEVEKIIKDYKLFYVPSIFVLNKDRIIKKILTPFESLN